MVEIVEENQFWNKLYCLDRRSGLNMQVYLYF